MSAIRNAIAGLRRRVDDLAPPPFPGFTGDAGGVVWARFLQELRDIEFGNAPLPDLTPPYPVADEDSVRFLNLMEIEVRANPNRAEGEPSVVFFVNGALRLWAIREGRRLGLNLDGLWPPPDLNEPDLPVGMPPAWLAAADAVLGAVYAEAGAEWQVPPTGGSNG